ncbi:M1 family metallopeptidase [Amycolatopsis nigrescens]|uniref:M1 family metallopeptidase n=1 Tax=Amycolatopsis nigrescens TaxID=381445 RepID=UPI0004773A87|nr:M1 family metallopeptidase [Amycolatopsis nigrescens]
MRSATRGTLLGATAVLIIGCSAPAPAPAPSPAPAPKLTPEPGASGAGDPYYPDDGNGGYDALDYEVTVSYDPAKRHLDGDSTVTAKATGDLERFNLDLRGLDVAGVEVDGKPAQFRREGEFELVITPAEPLRGGSTFSTRVRYSGTPRTGEEGPLGSNGWAYTSTGGAYVIGEPHSAAYWYPANETPRDKATFALTARVPAGWAVVSNGREEATATEDGWTTTSFREPSPVASYLTTIAVDRFTIDRENITTDIPVLSAYAPGAGGRREVGDRVVEVIEFLSDKFGPYPQSAAGGIYLNEKIGFSLETQTRPTYAQWADLETVVHENAHQWFGNSVSVASWADICLNECLASYAQWLWAEGKEGQNLDERFRNAVDGLRGNQEFWSHKLYDMGAGNEFDGVYDKGILATHALRKKVGEPVFAKVLREWPAAHKHGNASWPEFEKFVEGAAGSDLSGFFAAWFRGTGIPPDEHLYPGNLRG